MNPTKTERIHHYDYYFYHHPLCVRAWTVVIRCWVRQVRYAEEVEEPTVDRRPELTAVRGAESRVPGGLHVDVGGH